MKCDSQASLLACNFASLRLGHKPKGRVAIMHVVIGKLFGHNLYKGRPCY